MVGWQTAPPAPGTFTVTETAGQTVSNNQFGNFENISISGEVFNDLVGNGKFEASDPGLEGWTVELFNSSGCGIGVGGTSGKSTTTGMIGWILHRAGRDPTIMNGGEMKNFISVDVPFAAARIGHGNEFVCEVDESDGSIAFFRPRIAVVNNVSLDHKPVGELCILFRDFARKAETPVLNLDNV